MEAALQAPSTVSGELSVQPGVGWESQSSLQTYVLQTRRKEQAAGSSWEEEEEETGCQQIES